MLAMRCVAPRAASAKRRRSEPLDRRGKQVADATLGLNDTRRARIDFQFATKPQHLHVNAAVKYILVHASRVQ
jgi:hypothetical protein